MKSLLSRGVRVRVKQHALSDSFPRDCIMETPRKRCDTVQTRSPDPSRTREDVASKAKLRANALLRAELAAALRDCAALKMLLQTTRAAHDALARDHDKLSAQHKRLQDE